MAETHWTQQMGQPQQPPQMNQQALLQALLQTTQRPDPSAWGQEQAQADELARQLDNLDYKDARSRGVLGFFGRKSRDKKRQKINPQYQSELQQALSAKDQYEQQLEAYQTGNKRREKVVDEMIKAQFKDPNELNVWLNGTDAEREKIREYWTGKKGPGVTVNAGGSQVPKGFTLNPDGSFSPIKGSDAWYEREQDRKAEESAAQAAETKSTSRQAGIQRAGGTVVQDLGRAIQLIPEISQGEGVAGANVRFLKSQVKGSPEWYVNEFMDSALSNVGLDKLQQMRESSPTGGALGQVPIAQQMRLEKVLGQVDVSMAPQMMTDNMHRIQNIYFDIMYGSTEERALLVKQGKMTQEESDRIESQYYELSFDEFGKPKDSEDTKEINGKTYIKVNGEWFEQ